MRFALLQEPRGYIGSRSRWFSVAAHPPCVAPALRDPAPSLFGVFLEVRMENMLRFFFFSLSRIHFVCHLLLFFSFFFIIIILNIHYLETAGAWKPISLLISKSLQRLGGYVQAIT